MRFIAIAGVLWFVTSVGHAADDGKSLVVDKDKYSVLNPAVWFSPSTGEIISLNVKSEVPSEDKFEIWIEPKDPEFGYHCSNSPKNVG
jgi:hypothetical protein